MEYSSWLLERIATGDVIRLRTGKSTIGRGSTASIRTNPNSIYVSRCHAEITVTSDDRLFIQDLKSINGIFINGDSCSEDMMELKSGDRIGIGIAIADENEADLEHYIYRIKYVPIRNINNKTNAVETAMKQQLIERTPPMISKHVLLSVPLSPSPSPPSAADRYKNSNIPTLPKKYPPLLNGATITISDDDDDDYVPIEKTTKQPVNSNYKTDLTNIKNIGTTEKMKNEERHEVFLKPEQKNNICDDKLSNMECDEAPKNIDYMEPQKVLVEAEEKKTHLITSCDDSSTDMEEDGAEENIDTMKALKVIENDDADISSVDNAAKNVNVNANKDKPNETVKPNILHAPLVSGIKKEFIHNASTEIENIFGEPDDIIMDQIKNAKPALFPYFYNNATNKPKISDDNRPLVNGDLVIIGSDDEDDIIANVQIPELSSDNENIQNTVSKSPNIFETSNNSKDATDKSSDDNELHKSSNKGSYDCCDSQNDEDVEDIMFSQMILNDMKTDLEPAELDSSQSSNEDNLEMKSNDTLLTYVKKEPLDIELPCTSEQARAAAAENDNNSSICWIISDNEDFDEELEHKVSGWSNKLFSQCFPNSELSQVFELGDDIKQDIDDVIMEIDEDEYYITEENENNQIDDYDSNDFYNREPADTDRILEEMFATLKDKFNCTTTDQQEMNKTDEIDSSPLIRRRRKSKTIPMSSSESESENEHTTSTANQMRIPTKPCKIVLKRIGSPLHFNDEENLSTLVKSNHETITEVKDYNEIEADKKIESKLPNERNKSDKPNKKHGEEIQLKKDEDKKIQSELSKEKKDSEIKDTENNGGFELNKNIIKELQRKLENEKEIDKNYTEKKDVDKKNESKKPERKKSLTDTLALSKAKQCPPQIIAAPQLPKHKGKLRGVSAAVNITEELSKKVKHVREDIQQDDRVRDLKRKWLEKPDIAKAKEKERLKTIKIDRKERLQQLADKERQAENKVTLKRKSSAENIDTVKCKKPNVKVTEVNRGAFLTEDTPTAAKSFHKKDCQHNAKPNKLKTDMTLFERELLKLDTFKQKNKNKNTVANNAVTTKPICKDAINARAQRTTNKITFASMQKNMTESLQNKRKLDNLTNNRSCLSNNDVREANGKRHKKTVRFAEKPIIYEIVRICTGPFRKVNAKDVARKPLLLQERRLRVRRNYPLRDYTDDIITRILMWANDWLLTRNADATAARDGDVYPVPNKFNSYEHYKSIMLPLLKMEFITTLQRDFNINAHIKTYNVALEFVNVNKNRIILITKLHCPKGSPWNGLRYELVLLDFFKFKIRNTFAYVTNNRKVGNYYTLILEIPSENYNKEELLSSVKEISVRPVVDNLRLAFGPYNAMEQLESTPLFQTILNPLELLKYKKPPIRIKMNYKGYDHMNDQQRGIILTTYQKLIDESVPSITLIQGPPGTGKSRMITNLALQTLYGEQAPILDCRILICAQSNYAIDVVADKLRYIKTLMRKEVCFSVIRFGMLDKMKPEVANTISLQKIIEQEQLRKLKEHNPNMTLQNKQNLRQQIEELKAEISELKCQNIKDTVQEDELIQKQKQLRLMQNIICGNMRPDDEHNIYSYYLGNANIVCTTLSSCVKLEKYIDYFDICIIDEATQSTEPWTLVPLRFGINSLILVGDTQQLPATVLSKKASDLGLRTSLFTRIQRCLETQKIEISNGVFNTLQTQYRMNPEICQWPNAYFYKNELINGSITLKFKSDIVPFSILNLAYSQNDNCDNGKYVNDLEAEFVVKLIKALDPYLPAARNSYGVITPYALHRDTLSKAIKTTGISNIMVNTIDSYQGLEKDVIIISNARTRGIGFLSNCQRLNVALTRPRKCLILCGNFSNLESVHVWRSLLNNSRERGLYHEISTDCVKDINANVIAKIKVKY